MVKVQIEVLVVPAVDLIIDNLPKVSYMHLNPV